MGGLPTAVSATPAVIPSNNAAGLSTSMGNVAGANLTGSGIIQNNGLSGNYNDYYYNSYNYYNYPDNYYNRQNPYYNTYNYNNYYY